MRTSNVSDREVVQNAAGVHVACNVARGLHRRHEREGGCTLGALRAQPAGAAPCLLQRMISTLGKACTPHACAPAWRFQAPVAGTAGPMLTPEAHGMRISAPTAPSAGLPTSR